MVATWAAAHAGLTLDDIDDVSIAIEEAMLGVVDHGSSRLDIELELDAGRLAATVTTDGDLTSWPPETIESGLGRTVLDGVTDVVAVAPTGSIMFEKRSSA